MIQPADETPLPIDAQAADLYDRYPIARTASDALDAALAGIEDATVPTYHAAADALDAAQGKLNLAAASLVGTTDAAIDAAQSKIGKAVQRIDSNVNKGLEAAEDRLADAGATIPYSHAERLMALNDPTGEAIPAAVMRPAMIAAGVDPGALDRATTNVNTVVDGPPSCVIPGDPSIIGNQSVYYNGQAWWETTPNGQAIPGQPAGKLFTVDCADVMTVVNPPPPVPPTNTFPACVDAGDPRIVSPNQVIWQGVQWFETTPIGQTLPGQPMTKTFTQNCHGIQLDVSPPTSPLPPPLISPVSPPPIPPLVPPPVPPVSPPPIPTSPIGPGTPITIPPPPIGTSCPPTVIQVQCGPGTVPPTSPVPPGTPVPPTSPPPPGNPPSPPPDSPPPPTSPPATLQPWDVPRWSDPGACITAANLCAEKAASPGQPVNPGGPTRTVLGSETLGAVAGIIDTVLLSAFPLPGGPTPDTINWKAIGKVATDSGPALFPPYLPNPAAASYYCGQLALFGWAESVSHAPMSYLATWAQYELQYCNPMYISSQSELNSMYYRNLIDAADWECYTKANGNIVDLARKSMQAGATMPNVSDVVVSFMRGIIPDKPTYYTRMREQGVLQTALADQFLALAQQIPTSGDLVRFMVRDSGDQTVVDKYQYDFEFTDKFTPEIQEWARQNGIDEKYFKYLWRAHWEIPSNTQLYEMLHRLRQDTPEYLAWIDAWVDPQSQQIRQNAPNAPLSVTTDDVRTALQVNDVAPGWVDKLIATSYRVITNSDLRRGYMFGMYSKPRLVSGMQDNGYTKQAATELADFFEAEKWKTVANQTGVMTLRKLVKYYKSGLIGLNEFKINIGNIIPDAATLNRIVANTDMEIAAELKETCMKAEKKRYMYGEHSDNQTQATIAQLGLDPMQVARVFAEWRCEKESRLKEPRVAMLCTWYTNGYLTNDEYITRLTNLGYTEPDAYRIAASCWYSEMLKRWQKQIAEQKALIKEWQRLEKEQKADYKESIKQAQDQIKQYQQSMKEYQKQLAKQPTAQPGPSGPPPSPPGPSPPFR